MLMNVTMPNEPFNTAVRDGSVGEKMERILKETGPEAVYITEHNGHRGAILIFDLADPSKIPAVAEPWFLAVGVRENTPPMSFLDKDKGRIVGIEIDLAEAIAKKVVSH